MPLKSTKSLWQRNTSGSNGASPYVHFNDNREWKGGAEFEFIKVWGNAYGFTPKFKYKVDSYDKEDPPGMVYSVGNIYSKFGSIFQVL